MASHDWRIKRRQLAAPPGKVLHRVDDELQGRGEHGVRDLLEGHGQGVDVGAIERGDEGPVERLVHLGDDAVGLVLDLVHPLDDRLSVGVGPGRAAVDEQGADLVGAGGAALEQVEEMLLPG